MLPTSPIYHGLERLGRLFFPSIAGLQERERLVAAGDVFGTLYSLPLVLIGLAWLVIATNWPVLAIQLPVMFVVLVLDLLVYQLEFVALLEVTPTDISDMSSTLQSVLAVAVLLMFGANGLWVVLIAELIGTSARHWEKRRSLARRLNHARNLSINSARLLLGGMIALTLYQAAGGSLPIAGFSLLEIGLASLLWATWEAITMLIWLPILLLFIRASAGWKNPGVSTAPMVRFFLLSLVLFDLGGLFGVLAAGLYVTSGLAVFLFFGVALLLVSFLANRFSSVLIRVRRQTTLLEGLELLGRELLAAPPRVEDISRILDEYFDTAPLLMPRQAEVRLQDGLILAHSPQNWQPDLEPSWQWMWQQRRPLVVLAGQSLPWGGQLVDHSLLFLPIQRELKPHEAAGELWGGLYMQVRLGPFIGRDQRDMLKVLQPALHALAGQVAGALQHLEDTQVALERQRLENELELAGEIQASFLPDPERIPRLPGWQIAASLRSARETSGDFFDIIELPDGRLGLVIADVADKGVGAALYMALARTYLRAIALSAEDFTPGPTLTTVNRRILEDTRSDQFVTVLYAVLEPSDGRLTYANAGHPPALWVHGRADQPVQRLARTGMALGVMAGEQVAEQTIYLQPGDCLVFYTDGVSEAEDSRGQQLGIDGLEQLVDGLRGMDASQMQQQIITGVEAFTQGAAQSDDITMLLVGRK